MLRQRGDLDGALRHANDGLDLCRRIVSTEPASAGLATLAWIQYAQRRPRRRRGPRPTRRRGWSRVRRWSSLFNPGPAERARLLLALGEVDEVDRWVAERGLRETDAPSYPREREHLVLARLLLARGAPERALPLLGRLHAPAVTQGRAGSAIEVRARCRRSRSTPPSQTGLRARRAAECAGAGPSRRGTCAVFADEGAPMADLLRRLVSSAQRGYRPTVDEAIVAYADPPAERGPGDGATGAGSAPARRSGAPVLIEPLTEREGEVLLLLAEGKANREIAERLVVTLDTVKKHLTHIFGKLGAASRTQAVARARELGLLG